jgi:ABC-type antimicrobial peptide transport system permease subunit
VGEGRDPVQIVGVVGHVKQWSLGADDKQTLQAQLYEPLRQFPGSPDGVSVVMRADRVGPALWDSIRRVVREQSSQNVIYAAQTMHEVLGSSLAEQRFMMIVLDAFAISALLLASVGIYGVISYLVGRRTHEFGVRLALGAQCSDIVRLVLIHGMKMALAGLALGLIAALGLTRLMSEMLYGVSATDPAIFSLIALLLTAMALLACVGPARRATRVDPLVAVRHE